MTQPDNASAPAPRKLTCDGDKSCTQPITHLDCKGYIYCTSHGIARRQSQPCRKLTRAEIAKLTRGETITRY